MPRFIEYLVDAVRHPREKLTGGQQFVRYSCDLTVHCYRQLARHRAEGMAAELTYRTIFSLIPVVVLGLVMFRVVGGLEEVQSNVENQLYSFFGVPEIADESYQSVVESVLDSQVEPDSSPTNSAPTADGEAVNSSSGDSDDGGQLADSTTQESIAQEDAAAEAESARRANASIRRTLQQVTHKVATLDFASIGVFGLLLLIYAAVALADSTEHLFNRIYEAPSQRPLHIRIAIHWSITTLGSGLLAISLYLSGQVIDWFGEAVPGIDVQNYLHHGLAIVASWVLLFLLYALMPNTHVSVRAAAVGSLVGAVLWEIAKYGFQVYVTKAVPYSAIYGSIGLIPLFLFWIYVTWLIVLFGLILTYTLQTLRGSRDVASTPTHDDTVAGDPDWMLPIMTEVAIAFSEGEAIENQELADRLGLSSRVTHDLVGQLIDAGLIHCVAGGMPSENGLILAKPAESIDVQEILTVAHHNHPANDNPAWQTLAELNRAQRSAAAERTLADLLV